MTDLILPATALATALAFIGLGGGLYEVGVIDPAWPRRPDLIQPDHGGISRKRFWIPAHATFEVLLVIALALSWSIADVRFWLLVAMASHAVMRFWSAFDFIPKALAFEKAAPGTDTETAARRWTRRSLARLPLDILVCGAMLAATIDATRIA
ncbi:MAG: hypothetical protein ABGX47_08830 [Martelella sp.]|uniref:hypothetical protein n=1 Tax=Martelella sp. TaxID=1969699 RepID=UPI003242E21C